jgi:hypothetical protein
VAGIGESCSATHGKNRASSENAQNFVRQFHEKAPRR